MSAIAPYVNPALQPAAQPITAPGDAYLVALAQLRGAQENQRMVAAIAPTNKNPLDQGLPFEQISADLSGVDSYWTAISTGVNFDREGYALYYRREGSNPGGRLTIDLGGTLVDFYPGQRIKGYFKRFGIARASRSSSVGAAKIIIEKSPDAQYVEPALVTVPGEAFSPIDLLGTSSSATFASQNTATFPSGAAPAGSFDATGFSLLRLLLDTGSANTISFDLVPWLREPNSGLWYEQGSARFTVPAPDANQRYRVASIPVSGRGLYYFDVRNPSAALATLGFIIQGTA